LLSEIKKEVAATPAVVAAVATAAAATVAVTHHCLWWCWVELVVKKGQGRTVSSPARPAVTIIIV